ncbi:WD40-repeat-containing domain protein [Rhodocollybia butyracea]|uniref:WD40-repeat-containing domain protein n=1 Tax=Rhodocollybia butyracea TaxID=206335 RepID=A0A9P5Q8P1_9AGAR|nr:WD40-repeat-containing domain protein [Rhodocollybia butyracea]
MNYRYPDFLNRQPVPSPSLASQFQKRALGKSLESNWDRVKVLGDNKDYGHAGCVNALHWARDGEILLSAGDDRTVQIWRMDPTDISDDYPFMCKTVINTGHRANIFNTAMLPYSSRIATVAGDRQVRVFDVGQDHGNSAIGRNAQEYCTVHAKTHILKCHEDRVKRIATEESPDRFLTVSEDGTVRQHDLRVPHSCRSGCPAPLLQLSHELSALATSSFYCVVAGDSPYGYLFDRRFTGRDLQDERGSKAEGLTTCVRRFGRPNSRTGSRSYHEHITGARMSSENGHEVLLSYSADGVYLFSTLDDPETPSSSSIITQNSKRRRVSEEPEQASSSMSSENSMEIDDLMLQPETEESEEAEPDEEPHEFRPWVPVIRPQRRYAGARNVDTVKDVNFLGPHDEYVTSGSDDGNFFVWRKSTGSLHGVYEGDASVVNVIEGHPKLPLVAVSGIDHTVKLFAPVTRESVFSRMSIADSIMKGNLQHRNLRTIPRLDFITLLASVRASTQDEFDANTTSDCINQ